MPSIMPTEDACECEGEGECNAPAVRACSFVYFSIPGGTFPPALVRISSATHAATSAATTITVIATMGLHWLIMSARQEGFALAQ